MSRFILFLLLLCAAACSSFGKSKEERLREQQLKLGEIGLDQSQGWHFKGSLENPSKIEMEGEGYLKLLQQRKRQYGNFVLVSFVKDLAKWVSSRWDDTERLQIGDLSGVKGGKTIQHKSHQNGLDVDIVYLRNNRHEEGPKGVYWEEYFVEKGRLSPNFDVQRNAELLLEVAHDQRVEKIFVDKVIKKVIEEYSKKNLQIDEAMDKLQDESEQAVAARRTGLLLGSVQQQKIDVRQDKSGELVEDLDSEEIQLGQEVFVQNEKNLMLERALAKLVPAKLHKTHFHVRIHCPQKDQNCKGSRMNPKFLEHRLSQL